MLGQLATVDDLAAYLQRDVPAAGPADFYLRLASAAIIGYLGYDPSFEPAECVILDPVRGRPMAQLPGWPIGDVTKVEIRDDQDRTWSDVTDDTVVSVNTGIVQAMGYRPVTWPGLPSSWRVTYTRGFDIMPDAISTACVVVAGDAMSTEAGVRQEAQGGWNVSYLDKSGSLAPGSGAALGLLPYRLKSIA